MSECQECKWFVELDLNYGECHARAPVGGINPDTKADDGDPHLYLCCWPVVPANDYCGDHEEIPRMSDVLATMQEQRPVKKKAYQSMSDIRETLKNRRKRTESP